MAFNYARMMCSRSLLTSQFRTIPNTLNISAKHTANITLKVVAKEPESNEHSDERNERLKRELSPHLTIYKLQLPAVLSITHRFTGIALSVYLTTLGLGALVLPHNFDYYITMIEGLKLNAPVLFSLKAMLAFPFAYHGINGVRHLLWDCGKFLDLRQVRSTGYLMLMLTALSTIILASL